MLNQILLKAVKSKWVVEIGLNLLSKKARHKKERKKKKKCRQLLNFHCFLYLNCKVDKLAAIETLLLQASRNSTAFKNGDLYIILNVM